jgi:hypothetical protein
MTSRRSRIAARLRRRFVLRGKPAADGAAGEPAGAAGRGAPVESPAPSSTPLAALRGLGEGPAKPTAGDQAAEAELDTLRGELVRELDRLAEGDDGSGSFRRIAS